MLLSQEPVGLLIAAARRSLRHAVQERVTSLRLNPPQFWTLLAVAEEAGVSLGELARRQRIDAPAASRTVGALAGRGLVRVELDPGDRRRSRLSLTRRGDELVRKLRPIADDLRSRVVWGMDPAEETALRNSLRKVIGNLQGARVTRLEPSGVDAPRLLRAAQKGRRR